MKTIKKLKELKPLKTVIYVSSKGGVGKSRLSDELFYYCGRHGIPASFYSFDGQYKNKSEGRKAENPEIAIVDTPGSVVDSKTLQVIENADLVIVPTRPTAGNIESFTRTVSLVKKNANCPLLVVLNGNNRFKAASAFRTWLDGYTKREGLDAAAIVPHAEVMAQAENLNCSVFDVNKRSAASKAVEELCGRALKLAGVSETE